MYFIYLSSINIFLSIITFYKRIIFYIKKNYLVIELILIIDIDNVRTIRKYLIEDMYQKIVCILYTYQNFK